MLVKQNQDSSSNRMASYIRDSFENMTKDCHYRLKLGFPSLGIRYLHYYEKDHTLLVANVTNGRVHLLNIMTGSFRSFVNHSATVRKIRIFNGEIYTSSWDGSVRATNYYTLEEKMRFTERTMGRCPFFNITPDGHYLYSFTYDSDVIPMGVANSVRKWDMKTGKVQTLVAASAEQKSYRRSGSIIFYGDRVYVGCDSGYLRIFDAHSSRLIKEVVTEGDFRSMMALLDYNYLLASDWDGYIHFLDLKTSRIHHIVKAHKTDILCMRIHPHDRNIIFSSSSDGVIKVWQMPGFVPVGTIIVGHTDLWSMVFINNHLLSGNIDGEIRVYDFSDLKNIQYKGRIVLSDEAFVAQGKGSKMFYTNNPYIMEAYRDNPEPAMTPKEKEYLLDQGNNLEALKELFGIKETISGIPGGINRFIPQLGAHF